MDALRPQDPARIGAHVLLARLGAGGMGQVYLGRSPGGRLVAIKVIREEITDHPEALSRFRREAETVRAVRSAYTANLIDASLSAPPYWLATEYVTGPTLSHAVGERGPFPAATCRGVFAALAEGLASVHVYGVTHRDLKPQNIILSAQGPQLIDFGIARGTADTALTETGLAPGTPGFAAPEVLMTNQVGPAADVFALGATMAYAATGRAPFGGGQPAGIGYRVVHEPIDVAGVEPGLAALIEWCVAKDPAARPTLAALIERCEVRSALVDDAFYGPLAGLGEAAPVRPVEPGPRSESAQPQAAHPQTVHPQTVHPQTGHPQTVRPVGVAEGPPPGPHELPTATAAGQQPPYAPGHPATQVSTGGPAASTAPGRAPRRGTAWMVAAALVVAVGAGAFAVAQLMPGGKPGHGTSDTGAGKGTDKGTGKPSGQASADGRATDEESGKPPAYITDNRISLDRWALSEGPDGTIHGMGACSTFGGESNIPGEFQNSVRNASSETLPYVSDKVKIEFRIKYADLSSKRPEGAPYYISVGVKPPHEIDFRTGKPNLPYPDKTVGYTSRPVDAYTHWRTGDFVTLTYPDDFENHDMNGNVYDSIPVGNDPGDWTVVFYHVKSTPTDYASISCSGFRVK
ncbi:protein kinase [Streptomyces sp. NBC_01387]|uniref:serine/threonine protein kinase n=1 Tax=Streptomyces sp. NBC_01387 TaxID=2903849 RepID=UPI00324FE14F